jgi:hypothetical protein
MLAFWPSTQRSCGDCSTLVRVSLKVAVNTALGSTVDQSPAFTCPMCEKGIAVPVVLLPVPVVLVPPVVVDAVVLEVVVAAVVVVAASYTWMLVRGVKFPFRLTPVVKGPAARLRM